MEPNKLTDFLPVHRVIDGNDYYYILYRGKIQQTLTLTLAGTGNVTQWNPWNGTVMAVDSTETEEGRRISVSMKPGETAIFCVGAAAAALPRHAARELLRISDGWELEFERWERDESATDTTATRKTKIQLGAVPMKPWTELLGPDASGIGFYKKAIDLSGETAEKIVQLTFSDIRCQSVHLYINGEKVPVNHLNWTADCTEKFHAGENTVQVVVVSTLGNQLLAYGAFPTMPWMKTKEEPVEFGLLGDVVLQGE